MEESIIVAEKGIPPGGTPETGTDSKSGGPRSKDEVALDLMKFIAVATGYGKPSQSAAGFSAKPGTRTPEEHAEALLGLFERCRKVVGTE
jgi:hypothetical protein